jgi:hypothetical protein
MLPLVKEELVAGGPSDFMTARHLTLRGSNRMIGKELAKIARDRHKVKPAKGDPLITRARREYFHQNSRTHYERMQGVADLYGVSLEGEHDLSGLGYNQNVKPGCSTVYYPPTHTANGHAILSRNYDFSTAPFPVMLGMPDFEGSKAMTADPYVIEVYPDRGYPSLYVCAYDLLGGCIDGMNSEGLTVALLADDEAMSGSLVEPTRQAQAGFNEIAITRHILDTCACTEDAKHALMMAKMYYSFIMCHYIVSDKHGHSFIWEWSPAHNREYIVDGAGKPQVITNHPVHKYAKPEEMPVEEHPGSSYTRYRKLQERLAAEPKATMEYIKGTNLCVRADPPASQGRYPGRTLWHSVYDMTVKTAEIDFYLGEDGKGGQRRSGYKKFSLKP